jgi:transcriptional regulator with XRE-family HTH domain
MATEQSEVSGVVYEVEKAELRELHLAALREQMNLTQSELANALGVKQPTVSDMEKPGRDIRLSSLKLYVEAAGGKLSVNVELPDGTRCQLPI